MDTLSNRLNRWSQAQLSGRLDITGKNTMGWRLYFAMGRLAWAGGGTHPLRRWQRCLNLYFPQSPIHVRDQSELAVVQRREYQLLVHWTRKQLLIGDQAAHFIRHQVSEVLLDILQQEAHTTISFTEDVRGTLDAALALLNSQQALNSAQQAAQTWSNFGMKFSPNLALVIEHPQELRQQVPDRVYRNLVMLLDGDRTLRDLAVLTKQDLNVLAQGLLPLIQSQILGLVQVSDLPAPTTDGVRPLIACVDDSQMTHLFFSKLLAKTGYRFLGVENAVKALPTLAETQADLIFLDLMMPIVNGYELCSQIRRIPRYKDTPIVILTSNDGIIDRVRAKLVGSTAYLHKPARAEEIMAVLWKYLPPQLRLTTDPMPTAEVLRSVS
jgi:two-component system, chemotaxis family, response regulator PixG